MLHVSPLRHPCLPHFLDGVVAKRAHGHVDTLDRTGARRGQFAIRMCHCLQPSRRDAEGESDGVAEDIRACVGPGDVDEHAGPEAVFGEGGAVFVDGALVC